MYRLIQLSALVLMFFVPHAAVSTQGRDETILQRQKKSPEETAATPATIAETDLPFSAHSVTDRFDRTITYYLSHSPGEHADAKLPLVLCIAGSGCQSVFSKVGQRYGGGIQSLILQQAKGRCRVMVVEKPGVRFLDRPSRPGSSVEGSREFLREHTLERWVEANAAALSQVLQLDSIDRSTILVCGHSEGAIIACALAAKMDTVTHVAALSGAGVTQLYSLMRLADRRAAHDDTANNRSASGSVLKMWADIQDDPTSIDKFWMGHPYNRWSSFLRHSQVEFLLQTDAEIFMAHGELDNSSAVEGFDVMIATLLSKGRQIRFKRVLGADHGFAVPDSQQGPPVGLQAILDEVLEWTLD